MNLNPKTKNVEIDGKNYQIRRMEPNVGSYLLFRLLGAMNELKTGDAPATTGNETTAPAAAPSGEDIARSVVLAALFQANKDFEFHCFLQAKALAVISRLEGEPGSERPMPIMTSSGVIALPEIREDITLISKLEIESITFNLSPFFEGGGLKGSVGDQVASK